MKKYPEKRVVFCCFVRSCSCFSFLLLLVLVLAIRVKERESVYKLYLKGDKLIQVTTSLSSFNLLMLSIGFYFLVVV